MKRILSCICLLGITFCAFAQEEKAAAPQPASVQISTMQTALGLVQYGYANYSATALLEAAQIIAAMPVQELEAVVEHGNPQALVPKDHVVNYDPLVLVADAKKFAGKDKVVLAYAKKVEKDIQASVATRGAVGGPNYHQDRVLSGDTDVYKIAFKGGVLAEVAVIGDGDTDLDLYIYDANGNLIDSDTDYTDNCYCCWTPAWTGTFTIRIKNRGSVYNNYVIMTN